MTEENIDPQKITDRWHLFVHEVKQMTDVLNDPFGLYYHILMTQFMYVMEGTVYLGVPSYSYKKKLDDNRELLAKAMSRVIYKEVRVEISVLCVEEDFKNYNRRKDINKYKSILDK